MNFVTQLLPQRLVEALGWTLFHSLWQGALAALAFAVILYFTRRTSARLRYGLGLLALALALVASIATFWTHYASAHPATPAVVARALAADAAARPALGAVTGTGQPLAGRIASFFSDYFGRHLPLIVTLWLLGVLFLSLRFTGSMLYVQRLKYRQNRPLPPPWPEKLEALTRKAGLRRSPRLLESLRLRTPVVIGHLKPVLLLPVGLVSGLPAAEVEALLAHELAHVMRRDYLVNTLQNLVEILFFFHPGVRWISSCVRQEREHCCDDFAVELCGDARNYASALARLQEGAGGFPEPALAAAERGHRLLRRIARLLARPHLAHDFREGFLSALLLVVGLLGMLRLATAASGGVPLSGTAGGSIPVLVLAGAEKKPGPQATAKTSGPSRFERFSFTLEADGTVELAGEVVVGPGGPPTSWLLDMGSNEVVWYMASVGQALEGSAVRFSEEVALGRGAYGWYLPVGCVATARLKDSPAKGEWQAMELSPGGREAQVDRWSSGGGMVRAEREEALLKKEQEELLLQEEQNRAREKSEIKENEARLRAEEKRLREEVRAYEQRRLDMSEEEQRQRQHELQEKLAQVQAERQMEEERLRREQERLTGELEAQEDQEQGLLRAQEKLLQAEELRLMVEEDNFKKFLAGLVAAGLVSEADGYEIKLSADSLVINGRRQPQEVFQKYKQLYETVIGRKIEGQRTITFVSDKD